MQEKGSTLYFALVILFIASLIVLSISSILVLQIQTIKTLGDSALAFSGADTGLEEIFYKIYKEELQPNPGDEFYGSLDCIAYKVSINASSTCGAKYYCIKSIGTYQPSGTKRGLEASM